PLVAARRPSREYAEPWVPERFSDTEVELTAPSAPGWYYVSVAANGVRSVELPIFVQGAGPDLDGGATGDGGTAQRPRQLRVECGCAHAAPWPLVLLALLLRASSGTRP